MNTKKSPSFAKIHFNSAYQSIKLYQYCDDYSYKLCKKIRGYYVVSPIVHCPDCNFSRSWMQILLQCYLCGKESDMEDCLYSRNERLSTPPCQCIVLYKKEKQRCHFTHFGTGKYFLMQFSRTRVARMAEPNQQHQPFLIWVLWRWNVRFKLSFLLICVSF